MKKLLLFGCGTLLAAVLTAPALAAQPAVPSGPLTMSLTKKPVIFEHAIIRSPGRKTIRNVPLPAVMTCWARRIRANTAITVLRTTVKLPHHITPV